jgi:hypothetical protein
LDAVKLTVNDLEWFVVARPSLGCVQLYASPDGAASSWTSDRMQSLPFALDAASRNVFGMPLLPVCVERVAQGAHTSHVLVYFGPR